MPTAQGVTKNYSEAVRWYRKAAYHGNADAQYDLGIRYANGISVPMDYVEAYALFNLAAASLSAAGDALSIMAEGELDSVASRMTPAQIAEAQRLSRTRNQRR